MTANSSPRLMGWKFELVKHEDGEFGVRLKLLGFIPVANQQMKEMNLSLHRIDGREVLAYKKDGQSMLVGEKLHPQPLPDYLNEYVGEYDIVNPHDGPMPENIRVVREGDLLIGEFNSSLMPGFLFRTAFLPAPAKGELDHGRHRQRQGRDPARGQGRRRSAHVFLRLRPEKETGQTRMMMQLQTEPIYDSRARCGRRAHPAADAAGREEHAAATGGERLHPRLARAESAGGCAGAGCACRSVSGTRRYRTRAAPHAG